MITQIPHHYLSVSSSQRFGLRAEGAEFGQIQNGVKDHWKEVVKDNDLCFSQIHSSSEFFNKVKQYFNRMIDGFSQRWVYFRRGYGLFPKYIPEPIVIYNLKKFATPEQGKAELERLKKVEEALSNTKKDVTERSAAEKTFRERVATRMQNLDTQDFSIPTRWLNPFSIFQPVAIPSKDNKQFFSPEDFYPTCEVVSLREDSRVLLTRTKLGPHPLNLKNKQLSYPP